MPNTLIGRCIYCDDVEHLTREHVLPEGLGGRNAPKGKHEAIVLQKASCKRCTLIINSIEGECLGKMLGNFRARIGLVRKDRRPAKIRIKSVHFDNQGKLVDRDSEIRPEYYPSILWLPEYKKPYELGPIDASEDRLESNILIGNLTPPRISELGMGVISEHNDHGRYAQMLSKIALGYAVYKLGLDNFVPLIRDFILFGRGEKYERWIGGEPPAQSENLHQLSNKLIQANGRTYVVVLVHLFANMKAPANYVVVGYLRSLLK
jgi:hypothetical protein